MPQLYCRYVAGFGLIVAHFSRILIPEFTQIVTSLQGRDAERLNQVSAPHPTPPPKQLPDVRQAPPLGVGDFAGDL
tara:strand:- start:446 stop:673 length:228 start_codon:yes stop_codon:yes gene_type:complete